MKTLSENAAFGGTQGVYKHASKACNCDMTFAVYLPPQAKAGPVPTLWYLSGLTCTHENAMTKAAMQEHAARRGVAIVYPDTSPRGDGVAARQEGALGRDRDGHDTPGRGRGRHGPGPRRGAVALPA